MEMTDEQKILAALTMQLDLKAREYKMLCKDFEELKKTVKDPNDQKYVDLKQKFLDNQKELSTIKEKLKKLQNIVNE